MPSHRLTLADGEIPDPDLEAALPPADEPRVILIRDFGRIDHTDTHRLYLDTAGILIAQVPESQILTTESVAA